MPDVVNHVPTELQGGDRVALARRISYLLDREHSKLFGKPSAGTLQERCEILLKAGVLVDPGVYFVAFTLATAAAAKQATA